MANHFSIKSSHTQPVAAGTVVRFNLDPPQDTNQFDLEWHIDGPFTGMGRTVPGETTYDWDTAGERAGSYTVFVRRTQRPADSPEEAAGSGAEQIAGRDLLGAGAALTRGGRPGTAGAAPPGSGGGTGGGGGANSDDSKPFTMLITAGPVTNQEGVLPVSLQRTALIETVDQALWVVIRNRTNAVSFRPYQQFIDGVMGVETPQRGGQVAALPFRGGDAYALLKFATDMFLMQEVGVLDPLGVIRAGIIAPDRVGAALLDPEIAIESLETQLADPTQSEAVLTTEERRLGRPLNMAQIRRMRDSYYKALKDEIPAPLVLPYLQIIRERLADIPLKPVEAIPLHAYGILRSHLTAPLAIELLWSYWHEEGMLAQTLNAVLARFQNRRLTPDGRPDPLARFDIDPLRPLGNVFWGWMEDEVHRLTVRRRHFEYEHQYGLKLHGRAIPPDVRPVDRRSKFVEAFHNLLFLTHVFFKEDDDTTVIADGFPVLNALRETHLLLAEGAHNQFGDLPSTARSEMLVMEWLLARPEMRDFLGGRVMVPYEEPWMDRVDTMKSMQGWTDVSITHFRDMGVFGEQILLSIRYGNWSVENDPQAAANWARYWRPEIQRYAHAYRSATGVDLPEGADATLPAVLLRRRLSAQQRAELGAARRAAAVEGRRAALPGVITRGRVPAQRELE